MTGRAADGAAAGAGIRARSASRLLGLVLVLLVLPPALACTSRAERLRAEGVIVGIEAHVPQRVASITILTDEGGTLRLALREDHRYGFTVEELYGWVDAHRHVTVTYSRRGDSYVLDSIVPGSGVSETP